MRSWTTRSADATRRLGERLAPEVAPDGLVLLIGDLGSGKTALTQGIARGLGIDPGEVQSPTFTLMREHVGTREDAGMHDQEGAHGSPRRDDERVVSRLVHIDLYRLRPAEVGDLGLDEVLAEPAVKVIEWADRLPEPLAADLVLELSRGEKETIREVREVAPG